jgi:hypothetical protein
MGAAADAALDTVAQPAHRAGAAPARRQGPRGLVVTAAVVAIAAVWPLMAMVWAGHPSAVIGAGRHGPSLPVLEREIPGLVGTGNAGHDGQQFYVIARHPFDPTAAAPYLANPVYRYRRPLFSWMGGALAPSGGLGLVWAFVLVGLAAVGLSAWALRQLPDSPRWLPLVVVATPGVVAALQYTLADSLGLACTLAAFAAVSRRRWGWYLAALVAGVFTRETVVLVAVAAAVLPEVPVRVRMASLAVPVMLLAGWTAWVAQVLHLPISDGTAGQFGAPLEGWVHSTDTGLGLLLGALLAAVLAVGAWRAGHAPHVRWYLILLLVLFTLLSPAVTASWVNTSRAVIAGVPLAVWAAATSDRHRVTRAAGA